MGIGTGTASGVGAAANQRGPSNGRDFFVAKVNPHVVVAGIATASSNSVVVTFPAPLAYAAAKYAVVANEIAASTGTLTSSVGITKTDNGDGKLASVTFSTVQASGVVNFSVIYIGPGVEA
jgi:hypothetical protein